MPITEEFITIVIASYAAIISTLVALWNIRKDLIDKPKVKVNAILGFFTMPDGDAGETTISFRAVNIQKRPITITSFGIQLKKSKKGWQPMREVNLPKRLEEGGRIYIYNGLF